MRADGLAVVEEATARHDWQAVHDAALALAAADLDLAAEAERLDLLADAAWWLGRLDTCIEAREAAYRHFDELGAHRRAGQCAVWLYEHHSFRARPAIARGWLGRARRALGDDPESVEHGAMRLREAEVAHGRGELEPATETVRGVIDLARRRRSTDLEAEALQALGRLLIDRGDPHDGMAALDEAMLFAVEGRIGPYATGKVYCSLVSACEELGDMGRAAEWTEASLRWAERHPFAVFPGLCRVHRAATLGWRGALADAEREAMRACDELVGMHVPNAAAAFTEVGDLRRRLGDLAGAEVAFERAEEMGGRVPAGLALVRLAQGRIADALAIVGQALGATPWNRLARVPLLASQVRIALAAGDREVAATAVAELESTAGAYEAVAIGAMALTARAQLESARRDPTAATTARRAVAAWRDLDAPYDLACAHALLGHVLEAGGDEQGASASFAASADLFDRLGVPPSARPGPVPARRTLPAGLTEREAQVLALVAEGQTNKEIAAELCLSPKTVSRHLSNIFVKIGVSSRAAATAFAFEHHLDRRGASRPT